MPTPALPFPTPPCLLAGFTTVINSRRQEVVVEQVAALAKEHGAEELVLGHPVNMDGTLGPRSEKAKAMKVLLEEATSLPVVLWDERRTTIDAHNILFNSGKNAKQRKKVVDAVAASLILEGYLTFKKAAELPNTGTERSSVPVFSCVQIQIHQLSAGRGWPSRLYMVFFTARRDVLIPRAAAQMPGEELAQFSSSV